jgi:hypothetical protein
VGGPELIVLAIVVPPLVITYYAVRWLLRQLRK